MVTETWTINLAADNNKQNDKLDYLLDQKAVAVSGSDEVTSTQETEGRIPGTNIWVLGTPKDICLRNDPAMLFPRNQRKGERSDQRGSRPLILLLLQDRDLRELAGVMLTMQKFTLKR